MTFTTLKLYKYNKSTGALIGSAVDILPYLIEDDYALTYSAEFDDEFTIDAGSVDLSFLPNSTFTTELTKANLIAYLYVIEIISTDVNYKGYVVPEAVEQDAYTGFWSVSLIDLVSFYLNEVWEYSALNDILDPVTHDYKIQDFLLDLKLSTPMVSIVIGVLSNTDFDAQDMSYPYFPAIGNATIMTQGRWLKELQRIFGAFLFIKDGYFTFTTWNKPLTAPKTVETKLINYVKQVIATPRHEGYLIAHNGTAKGTQDGYTGVLAVNDGGFVIGPSERTGSSLYVVTSDGAGSFTSNSVHNVIRIKNATLVDGLGGTSIIPMVTINSPGGNEEEIWESPALIVYKDKKKLILDLREKLPEAILVLDPSIIHKGMPYEEDHEAPAWWTSAMETRVVGGTLLAGFMTAAQKFAIYGSFIVPQSVLKMQINTLNIDILDKIEYPGSSGTYYIVTEVTKNLKSDTSELTLREM